MEDDSFLSSLFIDFADDCNTEVPQFSTSYIEQQAPVQVFNKFVPNVYVCNDPSHLHQLQNMGIPFILVNLPKQKTITPVTPTTELNNMSITTQPSPIGQDLHVRRQSLTEVGTTHTLLNKDRKKSDSLAITPNEIVYDSQSSSENEYSHEMIEQINKLPAYDQPLSYFNPASPKQIDRPVVDKIRKRPARITRGKNSTSLTPIDPSDENHNYLVGVARKARGRKPKKEKPINPEQKFMMKFSLKK